MQSAQATNQQGGAQGIAAHGPPVGTSPHPQPATAMHIHSACMLRISASLPDRGSPLFIRDLRGSFDTFASQFARREKLANVGERPDDAACAGGTTRRGGTTGAFGTHRAIWSP